VPTFRDGDLVELRLGDRNLLSGPPRLQLWRAPTDNDGIRLLLRQNAGALGHWLSLGLDRLERRVDDVRTTRAGLQVTESWTGRGAWDDVRHRVRYRLEDGVLRVEHEVEIGEELRDLPRVGARWLLAPGLEQLAWYGPGPQESYSDRRASVAVARHESTVADEYVPYILPQEHGHHVDARWITLGGLRVEGPIGFSASHFTAEDLYAARHTVDLRPRAEIVLSLDHRQRGLGTASCGPDTSDEHKLLDRRYRFSYALSAAKAGRKQR
jgi:beta-galactosidase